MAFMILFAMIFCHLYADYNMQGILASFKQKEWWKENYPNKLYKNDWIISLIEHAFMWSFVTHIPLIYMWWGNESALVTIGGIIGIQCIFHILIDHAKANMRAINLVEDQCFHLVQIIVSWIFGMFFI